MQIYDDDDEQLARDTQADMRESLRLEGINDLSPLVMLCRELMIWLKKLLSLI